MKTKRLSLQQLLDSEVTTEIDGKEIKFKVGNVQGDKEMVTLTNEDKTIGISFYYLDLDRLIKGEETLAPVTLSCKTVNTKIKTYEDKVRGKQDEQMQNRLPLRIYQRIRRHDKESRKLCLPRL